MTDDNTPKGFYDNLNLGFGGKGDNKNFNMPISQKAKNVINYNIKNNFIKALILLAIGFALRLFDNYIFYWWWTDVIVFGCFISGLMLILYTHQKNKHILYSHGNEIPSKNEVLQ